MSKENRKEFLNEDTVSRLGDHGGVSTIDEFNKLLATRVSSSKRNHIPCTLSNKIFFIVKMNMNVRRLKIY